MKTVTGVCGNLQVSMRNIKETSLTNVSDHSIYHNYDLREDGTSIHDRSVE